MVRYSFWCLIQGLKTKIIYHNCVVFVCVRVIDGIVDGGFDELVGVLDVRAVHLDHVAFVAALRHGYWLRAGIRQASLTNGVIARAINYGGQNNK